MVNKVTHPKVQEFLEKQSPDEQAVLQFLRAEIFRALPVVREDFKWGVPYYRARKSLAFLNVRKGVVEIGFTHGIHLHDPHHWLQSPELKRMRHLKFTPDQDIDPEPLRFFLKQSADLAR